MLNIRKVHYFMLNHIKNNIKNSHFYNNIWHIANYILTLQQNLKTIHIV